MPASLSHATRWTDGFWAERVATCRQRTIPALWKRMEGTEPTHYLQNFRIAAGLVTGGPEVRHRGAPFNDGDFYKLLEASCASLAQHPDPALEAKVEEAVVLIGKAQRPDGYIHTRSQIKQQAPFLEPTDFELYNMGHLLSAACTHHTVTGRESFLTIARKTADFLERAFAAPTPQLARFGICPSHYLGLLHLYDTTKEPRYLALAKRFVDMKDIVPEVGAGDDNQDRVPFRQQTEAVGHAVRANYLYAGAAALFAQTGDRTLWAVLERVWESVTTKKLSLTGGCGALYDGASPDGSEEQKTITRTHQAYGRSYQLPHQTAHNETCASVGLVLWAWEMFQCQPEVRYIDTLEQALYNTVLAGVSLGGDAFFYNNPLRALKQQPAPLRWPRTRAAFFSSFCCPPNVARTVAQVSRFAYSQAENALWVNLYGSNTLEAEGIKLVQETRYPWDGTVTLTITQCPETLKLRIPAWADGASLAVNGKRVREKCLPGTYATLTRAWKTGDRVTLTLPLPVQLIEAHPLVEEARNQLAVQRGPLIYCLESADLPPRSSLLDIALPGTVQLTPRFDPALLGGVVVLEGRALVRVSSPKNTEALYRVYKPTPPRSIDLRLVPYFAWGNRGNSEMSVWLPHA
ncbi:glycoside hydrolase family 127 protein [Armatimonas rosea]|uniref:Glycoside hydrolase family 127 protein n=1 Tax=Armatimonas rosea TaxID=685828 RepID=A0A7W9W727_ARMRO|nr:glycoside hydrolase family 127 protein [Armatimonas rosea]MBB6050776.1 hypothetical protein [Armatimonas rosea]